MSNIKEEDKENVSKVKRWRLILGETVEKDFEEMSGPMDISLSKEELLMDQALAAIYNEGSESYLGARGAGRGKSSPHISRWLGDVRNLFDKDLVRIIQADAMERCGLKQLMFEPEVLENLEPNINLASTILLLKDQVPKQSKEGVRNFIKKIVEEINRLLESDLKRAVNASLNKRQHSPIPSASALDFNTTIKRGIKNYNTSLKRIVPEHYYFFDRQAKTAASKYTIILDIDQSGSMGESVIYSSIMSCILASMAAINTRVVAFDTNIVDLSDKTEDPVDLLFGFQLGGGTDINKSINYCKKYVENPKKTIFFLISDLMEGGNRAGMLRNLQELKESGVTVVCLLAIADGGKPYYDAQMATKIAAMDIACFACTPEKLPLLLEKTLKGQELKGLGGIE